MIEGLWTVTFTGPAGAGGGVVVLRDGKILGGDSAFTYIGQYRVDNGQLICSVQVKNFLQGVPNVLGLTGDFALEMRTPVDTKAMRGTMSLVGRPGVLPVNLVKAA